MASFQLYTDPLVSCPYNAAHRVKKSRMQIHLTKCKKNHVELDLRECPFNAQHRIPPSEFQYHLSVCEDRRLVERQVVYKSEEIHQGNTTVPSYKVDQPPVEEEYWDDNESTKPGYDPKKKVESGRYILIPQGQPVERRNAYKKMFISPDLNAEPNTSNGHPENNNPMPKPEVKSRMRVPKTTPVVLELSNSLGRGQQPTVRRKIAANIFGGSMETGNPMGVTNPCIGQGPLGVSVGLGRGLGRGRAAGIPGVHPPLAPGQVQFLE